MRRRDFLKALAAGAAAVMAPLVPATPSPAPKRKGLPWKELPDIREILAAHPIKDQLKPDEVREPDFIDEEGYAAYTIPFACLPVNTYIRGPKYRVCFGHIATPRFTKDVDELRQWQVPSL